MGQQKMPCHQLRSTQPESINVRNPLVSPTLPLESLHSGRTRRRLHQFWRVSFISKGQTLVHQVTQLVTEPELKPSPSLAWKKICSVWHKLLSPRDSESWIKRKKYRPLARLWVALVRGHMYLHCITETRKDLVRLRQGLAHHAGRNPTEASGSG